MVIGAMMCCGVAMAGTPVPTTPLPDTLSRTYRHTDAVKRLALHRDTVSARAIWNDIVAQDSTYAPALYYLSLTGSDVELARRAYEADSTNKWYTQHYATRLILGGDYRRAMPVYRRLLRLDPKNLQSYHALALMYNAAGMPYSAIAILDSAELRAGYNGYLAEIKHNLLLDTRQYKRAIDEGRRRTAEHPYDVDARLTLALSYDAAGIDSLARRTYDEAFRLDTTNISTIGAIADYYYSKGDIVTMLSYEENLFRNDAIDIEEKLSHLRQYTANVAFYREHYMRLGAIIQRLAIDYPNNSKVAHTYAEHMLAAGHHDQALELLRRHLEDADTEPEDYLYVLQLEHYMKSFDLMLTDLAAAHRRFPDNADLLGYEGFLYSEAEMYNDAVKLFQRAMRSAKRAGDAVSVSRFQGYIGDIYHTLQRDNRAFAAYAEALRYDGDNVAVLNNYAYYLSLHGKRLDEALAMAERVVELERNNATYIDTYAWILHLLGRNAEAKQQMQRALSLGGQRDADILAHYGDILWSLGEKFMAESYWKKAVEQGYDADAMAAHIAAIKLNN